jgi:hypothetical protein
MNILDLPIEVTLQIFGAFASAPDFDDDGLQIMSQRRWEGLAAIQACRLTCRALNGIVSGMLCPIFYGSLSKQTMERIDRLSRNRLIVQGIRGFEISLAFRPKPIAEDVHRYLAFVTKKIDEYMRDCDWHTEFGDYEDEDQSPEAVRYSAFLEAKDEFHLIRRSWAIATDPKTPIYGGLETDTSYQQLFKSCFAEYSATQKEVEQIVNDGSFVKAIAEAVA